MAALCGALCGAATWTSSGVLAVDTLAQSPRIVGLIPSFATLAIAILIGAAGAVWAASRQVPAGLFLLPLIGSLPLTRMLMWPSVVAWAGPSIILPFSLLVVGVLLALLATRRHASSQRLMRHIDSRWSPYVAATATALWLIGLLTSATSLPLTGDEPHYLLVTQSILSDKDIDLRNNHDAETYRSFYFGPLQRHVTLGYLAEEYSFHGLALSVLLIPSFALGGVLGSRLLIILVTAAGAGVFWAAARRITDSPPAAWAGWLAMVSAAPFALHGFLMYPDGVAAAVTSVALWVLVRATVGQAPSTIAVVAAGSALATLPWFHIRLSLTAGIFGLAMVWTLARRGRDLIMPFLAAPIIGFVLWIASTWVMFHTLDPTAAFRERAASSLAQVPVGTLGLLFDAEYGLLTYAPVLSFGLFGVAALRRRSNVLAIACVTLIATTVGLGAAWIWWGGDSAPARFLAPIVPLAALCVATWWAQASTSARSFAGTILVMGVCVTACAAAAEGGTYILNNADGRATIWEWLSPNVEVSLALPSLFRPGAQPGKEALVAVTWIAAGAIAFAITLYLGRHSTTAGASWLRASMATMVWLTVGASVAWGQRDVTPWTSDRGQLRMLYAATSPTLSNGVPLFTTREAAVSSLNISTPFAGTTSTLLHVPFVPAGRYKIHVQPTTTAAFTQKPPTLALELGREASPFTTWSARDAEPAPTFTLAMRIWAVHVVADAAQSQPVTVRLQPQAVQAPSIVDGVALRATRYDQLVVYSLDHYTLMEPDGFWLAADRHGSTVVTNLDGRAVPHVVHVEAGAAPSTVTIERGTFARTMTLAAGATEQVTIPEDDPGRVSPLRFAVSGGAGRLGAFVRVSP